MKRPLAGPLFGFHTETSGIPTCEYNYVADGKEKNGRFQCTINSSEFFLGDYINFVGSQKFAALAHMN
jgi:hypothetical protein